MTPKEKARQLVESFKSAHSNKMSDYSVIYLPTAIQCALICVREILETAYWEYMESFSKEENEYWLDVEQEILNYET